VIAAESDASSLAPALRTAIHEVNSREVLYDLKPMSRVIEESLGDVRLYLWLVGGFAAVAAALAAIGVYGVIAFLVSARTGEFALRLALGAQRTAIVAVVLRYGALVTGAGLLFGIAAAAGASRVMENLPIRSVPVDATRIGAAAILLAIVALAACIGPARRAMSIEPVAALRHD
jgi:ABC-type antimicrobial peptide transport system permease subunit